MEQTLGKRIAAHRKGMGMTQDQLAEQLGITAQAVSKWENDLSCPDITILPRLADIFGTTTDALLGRPEPVKVCEVPVMEEDTPDQGNGFIFQDGHMDFHWNGGKAKGIGLACWILLTGILYLFVQFASIDVSLWNIIWPTFLITFGVFGLFPKFSAIRFGCGILGIYFLLSYLQILNWQLDKGIIIAAAVVLLGIALLLDALRKKKSPGFGFNYKDTLGKAHQSTPVLDYNVGSDSFTYDASFGSSIQPVVLENLCSGTIDTNFGEYTIDLSAVGTVAAECRLSADCNFGSLTILVPRHFAVVPDSSTVFATLNIIGEPDRTPKGTIHLEASVNFGEICIRYL